MVVRSENFLRGGARDHVPCCVKGRKNYPTAIFKAFSKNARIGDRSGYRAFRSRVRFLKMPESGIDPATVRKSTAYSVTLLECLVATPLFKALTLVT